jgi:hypothetical protein
VIVHIPYDASDDELLITAWNNLLANLVEGQRPEHVFFIRIRNWFDHKWLGYSGSGVVDFPAGYPFPDVALEEMRQDELTVPPFTPQRVAAELAFCRTAESRYDVAPKAPRVHRQTYAGHNKSLHRRVTNLTDSGLFFWFSSGSQDNGRAALMSYAVHDRTASGWYASFVRSDSWRVHLTKGIDRREIVEYFPQPDVVD